MDENVIETQYDVTKKSKLKKFYNSYKIFIYSSLVIVSIFFVVISIYSNHKKNQNILASENYLKAKIYLGNGEKNKAKNILKDLISFNNSTYSTLAFFLILNKNLITNQNEIEAMFDDVLKNNDFDNEIQNLLIYKKALYRADFINESELLEDIKPLLKSSGVWKPHALLLVGDYFLARNEGIKAKEFYKDTLSIKNLQPNLYDHALHQLVLIENDLQ